MSTPQSSINRFIPSFHSSKEEIYEALVKATGEIIRLQSSRQRDFEKYRAFFHALPEAAFLMELGSFKIIAVNPAALALYGYTEEEFLAMTAKDLRPAANVAGFMNRVALAMMPTREFYSRHCRKDGSIMDVTLFTNDIIFEGRACRLVQVHDTTRKKRTDEILNFLSETGVILASSLDYTTTLDRILELATKQFGSLMTIHLKRGDKFELVGVRHLDRQRETSFKSALGEELRLSDPHGPSRVVTGGRSELFGDLTSVPIELISLSPFLQLLALFEIKSYISVPLIARGRVLGAVTIMSRGKKFLDSDVGVAEEMARRLATAVENSELFKESQEAIKVRDDFLSIASHELKTPLSALRLHLQFMRHFFEKELRGSAIFEKSVKVLANADRQVERAGQLINDLLDISLVRTDRLTLDLEEIELNELIESCLDRFKGECTAAGCDVKFNRKDKVVGTWDRLRLEQIFTNLLTNALKYGPRKPIEIDVTSRAEEVEFAVSDHGIGIKEEDLGRIFNKFERATATADKRSLGLGLYITQEIVRRFDGRIGVRSEVGKGSTFFVVLPLKCKKVRDNPEVRCIQAPALH